MPNQNQQQNQNVHEVSKKNKKTGFFLIIAPIIILIMSKFMFYVVMGFIVGKLINSTIVPWSGEIFDTFCSNQKNFGMLLLCSLHLIIHTLVLFGSTYLVFLALILLDLLMLASLFGIPIGIVFLFKKNLESRDRCAKVNIDGDLPREIKGWNWGAAGLTWVWGVYHNIWLSVCSLVPFLNLWCWIILGLKGNELVWKSINWKDADHFVHSQRRWKPWGITFFILNSLFSLFVIFFIVIIILSQNHPIPLIVPSNVADIIERVLVYFVKILNFLFFSLNI